MIDKEIIKAVKTFIKTKKTFIKFWERLDIPIDDVSKRIEINTNAAVSRMFKGIREDRELYELLPKNLGVEEAYALSLKKRNERLKEIFRQNMELILTAYFSMLFGNSFQAQSIWTENNVLTPKENAAAKSSFAAKTFLTYRKDKGVLDDVYYGVVLIKNDQDKYKVVANPRISGNIKLDKTSFEKIINTYEKAKRNYRNRIKVWWFKEDREGYEIVFRRSLSKSIRIRQVNRNKFQVAADEKVLILKKNGLEIGLYTRKNKRLILKYLKQLLEKRTGAKVVLEEAPFFLEKKAANKLIGNLLQNKSNNVRLVEATISNFPINTNPEVKVRAVGAEGIEEAIADFGRKNLTIDNNYIKSMRVKYQNRYFTLRPSPNGNDIVFEVGGKGVNGQVKNEFLKELDKVSGT